MHSTLRNKTENGLKLCVDSKFDVQFDRATRNLELKAPPSVGGGILILDPTQRVFLRKIPSCQHLNY